jgi:hypothetical protein
MVGLRGFLLLIHVISFTSSSLSLEETHHRRLRFGVGISNFIDNLFGRNKNCPPKGFTALSDFNFTSYISKSWYSVKQIPLAYQRLEDFYCVRADYIKDTSSCFLCGNSPKVQVYNQARRGSVNGTIRGTPYTESNPPKRGLFRAFQKDPQNQPAKLTVGFFSQISLSSNYWVVAAGTYADAIAGIAVPSSAEYDWAIISAGSPDLQTQSGLCIPKPGLIDFYGMWMFARDGVPPTGVIAGIDQIATSLGLDNTKWRTVDQTGCVFA